MYRPSFLAKSQPSSHKNVDIVIGGEFTENSLPQTPDSFHTPITMAILVMILSWKQPLLTRPHIPILPGATKTNRELANLNTLNIDQFLAKVERRAFTMANMGVKHQEDALDIVQDAMMAFAMNYGDKPQGEWKPLFYRVLNNKIMDFHRRQSVRNRWRLWLDWQPGDDMAQPIEDSHPAYADSNAQSGEHYVASEQRIQQLSSGLEALPPRQRQAFLLRCWEGLSTRDAATAMSCSEGSVKTHYSRALLALRQVLKEHRELL